MFSPTPMNEYFRTNQVNLQIYETEPHEGKLGKQRHFYYGSRISTRRVKVFPWGKEGPEFGLEAISQMVMLKAWTTYRVFSE
jgi:hypothetical protein